MSNDTESLVTLFNKGHYEKCLALSTEALVKNPRSAIAHEYICLSLFALNRHKESIPYFQKSIKLSSPKINGKLWRRATKALRVAKFDKKNIDAFWAGCSSSYECIIDDSRSELIRGNADEAIRKLEKAIKDIFPIESQLKLLRCLRLLGGLMPIESTECFIEKTSSLKIILVAGMGWSGSGAIFDYLSEFDNVVSIKGESPFIARGQYSLASIYESLSNSYLLRDNLIGFFYFNLLGFSRIFNGSCLKTFGYARALSLSKTQSTHFKSTIEYCVISRAIMQTAELPQRKVLFAKLTELVVRQFSAARNIPNGGLILMDNVVPIEKIDSVPFLNKVTIYCCFRDPRSNYVSQLREDTAFNKTIESYISSKKKSIDKLNALVEKMDRRNGSFPKVHRVQFEEFVFSESYRDTIAESLGLCLKERRKHSSFKPWESMRNALLHQEHQDQAEIRMIEDEIPQHCVEPCVRSFIDVADSVAQIP